MDHFLSPKTLSLRSILLRSLTMLSSYRDLSFSFTISISLTVSANL